MEGCFSAAFEPAEDSDVPLYLSLMNVRISPERSETAFRQMAEMAASADLDRDIVVPLKSGPDWRRHLVSGTALLFKFGDDCGCASALWAAIDRGSWANPQLTALAFLLDPLFEAGAQTRVLVEISDETRIGTDPQGRIVRDWKALTSLVGLLSLLPDQQSWLAEYDIQSKLEVLKSKDLFAEDFSEFAVEWMKVAGGIAAKRGISLARQWS